MHLPSHDVSSPWLNTRPHFPYRKPLLLLLGFFCVCLSFNLSAQTEITNESLLIKAAHATTWSDGTTNILQIEKAISIDLDQTHLTADGAVIWLTPTTGAVLDEQRAEIALVGHASVMQGDGITRSADTLFVTATIRGSIRLTADERQVENKSTTDLFKSALMIRPRETAAPGPVDPGNWLMQRPWAPSPATTQSTPTTKPAAIAPIFISADNSEATKTTDGLIANILSGNVKLFQKRPMGEFLELRAERVVIFTTLHDLSEMQKKQYTNIEQAITGAYLEGDVRLIFTPAASKRSAEQRLTGKRVFYDFTTDRAILTEAVLHTYSPKTSSPIILRAQIVRQLSAGEYTASKAQLTTSSFATPSYSIGLGKAYVRQVETGDPTIGTFTEFSGDDVTFQVYNQPVFYFPHVGGTMDERGSVFRNIEVSGNSRFGPSLITQWGLFESLGKIPPRGTDITYQLDYFGKRGPAAGIDGKYQGGIVTDTTKDPWDFSGDFSGLFIEDHGKDKLDRLRPSVIPPTEQRGRFFLEHQQFLPDSWQMQLSLGYSSDPTFLEEWYQDQFYTHRPQETALYLKRQHDTEALTFLVSKQINNFPTSSDLQQEQAEVERLPEVGYRRIGDSLLSDTTTFFSENSVSGLDFHRSRATLADQGFGRGQSPGLPSYGTTGEPGTLVYRGDFRQELDYPFSAGQFRIVPYVIGRYTVYSDSPTSGGIKNRLYSGAGVRASTAFWKVDDSVESTLFDLHRLRHVIEPEINVFSGAQNVNRNRLFQYDESVDEINDITGAQLALRQRWQTKRGGPGRWRGVDVFSFNVEGNFYTHKPVDALIQPTRFRGLFFDSVPEESIPRNSVNADANWRISDSTEIITDAEYNLDQRTLATASAGFAVQRGERISYFLGQRYIEPLKSNITTFAANYQLTSKYTLSFRQSFDFGLSRNVASEISFIRHFDRFFASVSIRYDEIGNNSGFMINLIPEGFGTASGMRNVFQR
jgi:hypothetical protein